MNMNNINTSTIKTKIGNFLLESDNKIIIRFFPTKNKLALSNSFSNTVQNHLNNYFSGKEKNFYFKIRPFGTNFQKKVWYEVSKIKYGKTAAYFDIAKKLNTSPRAIGNACANNPCLLFIPCHRIIHKNNLSGNYMMGIKIKKTLLNLEKENY